MVVVVRGRGSGCEIIEFFMGHCSVREGGAQPLFEGTKGSEECAVHKSCMAGRVRHCNSEKCCVFCASAVQLGRFQNINVTSG